MVYHCCLKRQKIFDRSSRAAGASAADAAARDGKLIQQPRPPKGLTDAQWRPLCRLVRPVPRVCPPFLGFPPLSSVVPGHRVQRKHRTPRMAPTRAGFVTRGCQKSPNSCIREMGMGAAVLHRTILNNCTTIPGHYLPPPPPPPGHLGPWSAPADPPTHPPTHPPTSEKSSSGGKRKFTKDARNWRPIRLPIARCCSTPALGSVCTAMVFNVPDSLGLWPGFWHAPKAVLGGHRGRLRGISERHSAGIFGAGIVRQWSAQRHQVVQEEGKCGIAAEKHSRNP